MLIREKTAIRILVISILLVVSGDICKGARARRAAVYFSDGTVLTGMVSLTSGRKFKLNIPQGGSIKTTDMVTGEDVKYGKVRLFDLEPLREIRFYPSREEMYRRWKFIEKTKYDEKTAKADYTPAAKSYKGKPYPLRYLNATAVFAGGETLQGHLYTIAVYLQADPTENNAVQKRHKLVLRSKQRGKPGTTLNDLVYVSRIKLLDEGKKIAAKITVTFTDMNFAPDDAVQAMTCKTLTPVPTKKTEKDNTFIVESTFGEEFYLAARKDGKYLVGWPGQEDGKLKALADDHLNRHRDFYNDRKLLAVLADEEHNEVLTLVSLRRKVAPTHFGEIGGEWDKELAAVVEPWRLSIWRWKYDRENQELVLSARGTFFRIIFQTNDPTPQVVTSEKLWDLYRNGDTVTVGAKDKFDESKKKKNQPR